MGDAVTAAEAPLVLVVDDNDDARMICERSMRRAGYRTVTVASGREALARLDEIDPAVVVLDLAMPDTDGFATARAIRARPRSARLPILVVTGLSPDVEARAREAGGDDFCLKPIEPRSLVACVRRLCPLE
jgi:two-component system alkaline phosphatase synthesis response regulator PhoP